MKLGSIEKDRQPSIEIIRLFEKTRVAYLSARHDPKEYGSRWRKAVDLIEESYEELDAAGKELKNFIDADVFDDKEINNVESNQAKELYEKIKLVRYNSDLVVDPFAKRFKGNVLEELLNNPESMVKFVHYALRNNTNALTPSAYAIKDMEPDDLTDGLEGLDLQSDDIGLYIIEHYGDGKDSKKVEKKVKAAMDMLQLIFFSQHEEKEWEELKDIEMKKSDKKSEDEKSISDFIIPNKPMYRIFEIDDLKELKGFSGQWYVQEKYDGMRVQLHKLDNSIKVYSYNKKNITDKCKDIVSELRKKHFGDCILDAELILFSGDDALHRADTIAHVFKDKYKDAKLRCHVFDIMRHDEQTLLDEELENRMGIMFNNYSAHSSEHLVFPSKKDTRMADSLKDIDEYAKKIMDMPTAEGVVIKDATSTYYLGTRKNPKWIKWKKFVDIDVIVLDKTKTKSNLNSYVLGVDIGTEDMNNKFIKEIDGKKYMNVGKALNTKISANVGDIVRVKVDEVKKTGDRYTLYSAKVIEIPEVEMPDKLVTLEFLSQDTKKSLNYNVDALKKGVQITDHIHGEANLLIKFDTEGLVFYSFEENNLMAKNALLDIDVWKTQVEEIMKTKQANLTLTIFRYLKDNGPKPVNELHNYLMKEASDLYKDILEGKAQKLKEWANLRDGITFVNNKLQADEDKILQETEEIKKQKLVQELREQEKEEERAITIDSDEEGDCCTQLKNKVIEYKREQMESIIDTTKHGSWGEVRQMFSKSGLVKEAHSFEDYMDSYSDFIMNDVDCEWIIEEYLPITNNEELIEEYNQCQFGSGFSDKYAMLKGYKTPKEKRSGLFKIYARQDDNVTLSIKLDDETINWTIDLENEKELFDLFGAAGKYPAEVSSNIEKEKVIDSGTVELGVQRHGYHEYMLDGNKFQTKLHVRYLPVKGEKMWLAWTGYEQEPADPNTDDGIWNIYEDKYSKVKIP